MQQHIDIAHARHASQPSTTVTLLWGVGLVSGFAAALLALTALLNPAWAETPRGDLPITNTPGADIPRTDIPNAERQRELIRFVRQECGFCHGLRLTGGLGTPLTAEALADKSADALEATILYGRTGTAMPGWSPFLSETDTHWIVHKLLQGFPDETASR